MKKKILIRIGSLRHGGAEKVLVTFLKNIPPDKYDIDLLLNLNSGKYLKEVPTWINVLHLFEGEMITTNRPQDILPKAYRVITQKILKIFPFLLYKFILKNKQYDIEFAAIHGFLDEILGSPQKKSKKLIWIHSDLSNIPEYTPQQIRKFFGFDKILVISEKIQNLFLNLAKSQEEKNKIIRIYNPIDSQEIFQKSKISISFPFDDSVKTFVSVGTIFPAKGFDRLLKVHKKLLDEGLQHHIVIVGDGYDFKNIENLIKALQVENTVKMMGYQENPYPFIKNGDFFMLSSRYEGYPTVLFEAILLNKPIIATDVSGVCEILQNGKLGLIVENSEAGIEDGMRRFLTQPEFPQNYLFALKSKILPFTLENSVNSLMKIIDEL